MKLVLECMANLISESIALGKTFSFNLEGFLFSNSEINQLLE